MIPVREAQRKILATVPTFSPTKVNLKDALGRYTAETILSPIDSPPFRNSAMDGYALREQDSRAASPAHPVSLPVVATVSAGVPIKKTIGPGEALRIFTGAMMPEGLNAVVKQEDVVRNGEVISLTRPATEGENIRPQGEELKRGNGVFPRGTALTPAAIALLAGLGLREVPVHAAPKVGILITGSEIVTDPKDFSPGKIFDSNSFALAAALQELSITPAFIRHCGDQLEELRAAVIGGLEQADFLLITGGVSVGDFDFVKEAARAAGVEEVFWKVSQKPGKPLYFGAKEGRKFLFGLPGNPASVLVCFYEYVRPALLHSMGSPDPLLPRLYLPLQKPLKKKPGMVHFLRASVESTAGVSQVRISEQQGSHLLKSFAEGNCLVVVPEAVETVAAGEAVEVHLLPSALVNVTGRKP